MEKKEKEPTKTSKNNVINVIQLDVEKYQELLTKAKAYDSIVSGEVGEVLNKLWDIKESDELTFSGQLYSEEFDIIESHILAQAKEISELKKKNMIPLNKNELNELSKDKWRLNRTTRLDRYIVYAYESGDSLSYIGVGKTLGEAERDVYNQIYVKEVNEE